MFCYRYDFNNFGSVFNRDENSNPTIPNKKLAPLSFGTTNKSLDMNNNSDLGKMISALKEDPKFKKNLEKHRGSERDISERFAIAEKLLGDK